tara:strand:- start:572 stop:814 length:243 start_codon:yes stop_codon:yes gene_type:complete
MPDFEKLIKHQQLKQPTTNKRLKVVDSTDLGKENVKQKEIKESRVISNFFGGFIGSVIGTLTILFFYVNDFIPMDLITIK